MVSDVTGHCQFCDADHSWGGCMPVSGQPVATPSDMVTEGETHQSLCYRRSMHQ